VKEEEYTQEGELPLLLEGNVAMVCADMKIVKVFYYMFFQMHIHKVHF